MAVITYTTGDATQPVGPGPKILVHVCNDRGPSLRPTERSIAAIVLRRLLIAC